MSRNVLTVLLTLAAGMLAGCTKYEVNGLPKSNAEQADILARRVAVASGAENLERVSTISFTFVLREGNDVKVSRSHVWNLKTNSDTITAGDKPVTIDLCNPDKDNAAQTKALKTFNHDVHWLLAPLKLFDPGVTRSVLEDQEIRGKTYQVLHLAYSDAGAAPVSEYNLYIDPYTHLVACWDEIISPEKTQQGTWERYQHPAGLKVATLHKVGDRTIAIENLRVETE